MSYLYSKLPETGVSPHIGTGGTEAAPEEATPGPLLVRIVLGQWAQRSAESGMGTT